MRIEQGWTALSTEKWFCKTFPPQELESKWASLRERRARRGKNERLLSGRYEGSTKDWVLKTWCSCRLRSSWSSKRFNMVQESESAAVDWNQLAGQINPLEIHLKSTCRTHQSTQTSTVLVLWSSGPQSWRVSQQTREETQWEPKQILTSLLRKKQILNILIKRKKTDY